MDNVDRMYRHLVRTVRSRFPHYLTQPFEVGELYQTILPYRHHRRELGLDSNEDYEITLTELLSGARDYMIVDDRMANVLREELASVNPDPSAFKQFASSMVALAPAAVRSLDVGPADELSPPRVSAPSMRVTPSAVVPPTVPAPIVAAPAQPSSPPIAAAPAAPVAPPAQPRVTPPPSAPLGETAERSTSMSRVQTPVQAPGLRPSPAGGTRPGFGTVTPQVGDSCPSCNEALPPGRPITFCPHCGQNITTRNCPACGSELEVGWRFCPVCGRPAAAH